MSADRTHASRTDSANLAQGRTHSVGIPSAHRSISRIHGQDCLGVDGLDREVSNLLRASWDTRFHVKRSCSGAARDTGPLESASRSSGPPCGSPRVCSDVASPSSDCRVGTRRVPAVPPRRVSGSVRPLRRTWLHTWMRSGPAADECRGAHAARSRARRALVGRQRIARRIDSTHPPTPRVSRRAPCTR